MRFSHCEKRHVLQLDNRFCCDMLGPIGASAAVPSGSSDSLGSSRVKLSTPNRSTSMDPKTEKAVSILAAVVGIISGVFGLFGKSIPLPGTAAPYLALSLLLLAVLLILQRDRVRLIAFRWPVKSRIGTVTVVPLLAGIVATVGFDAAPPLSATIALLAAVVTTALFVAELFQFSTHATTRYLGPFPDNLPTIIDELQTARSSVCILTDLFAYGAFSSPTLFQTIVNTIHYKRVGPRKVPITWCAYSDAKARESVIKQLSLANIGPGTTEEGKFLSSDNMRAFLDGFNFDEPKTLQEFLDIALTKINSDTREQARVLFCKIGAHIQEDLPVYIWLIDDRVAVFSVHVDVTDGQQEYMREDTFITHDPALLLVLRDIGRAFWNRAT
jgi:hypothetical protein